MSTVRTRSRGTDNRAPRQQTAADLHLRGRDPVGGRQPATHTEGHDDAETRQWPVTLAVATAATDQEDDDERDEVATQFLNRVDGQHARTEPAPAVTRIVVGRRERRIDAGLGDRVFEVVDDIGRDRVNGRYRFTGRDGDSGRDLQPIGRFDHVASPCVACVIVVSSSTSCCATARSRPLMRKGPAADAVVTMTFARRKICSNGPR